MAFLVKIFARFLQSYPCKPRGEEIPRATDKPALNMAQKDWDENFWAGFGIYPAVSNERGPGSQRVTLRLNSGSTSAAAQKVEKKWLKRENPTRRERQKRYKSLVNYCLVIVSLFRPRKIVSAWHTSRSVRHDAFKFFLLMSARKIDPRCSIFKYR